MLKKQRIGRGMIIVGGLMPEDRDYYNHVVRMIRASGLSDYIKLEANATSDILKSIMRKGKVYFHPTPGEPFGISIVEAMSAGLIPIVPSNGGHTDFVPEEYRFGSLEDAAAKICLALTSSQEARDEVSNMVASFSQDNYIKNIQRVIENLMSRGEEAKIKLDVSAKAQHPHRAAAA